MSSYVLDKYATILSSTLYKQRFLVISLFGILNMKGGLLLRLKLSELSKVLTVTRLWKVYLRPLNVSIQQRPLVTNTNTVHMG